MRNSIWTKDIKWPVIIILAMAIMSMVVWSVMDARKPVYPMVKSTAIDLADKALWHTCSEKGRIPTDFRIDHIDRTEAVRNQTPGWFIVYRHKSDVSQTFSVLVSDKVGVTDKWDLIAKRK